MKRILCTLIGCLFGVTAFAASKIHPINHGKYWPKYQWAVGFSRGYIVTNDLDDLAVFKFKPNGTGLYALDISYQPLPYHWYQKLAAYAGAQFSIAMNFTYLMDPERDILQFNPYFDIRWSHFPWQRYLLTSFAAGEGVSYSSDVPTVEKVNTSTNFLNYLMFQITVALPKYPQWELFYRIYHRSGVYGLFYPWNGHAVGSNAFGFGVRYLFNLGN